MTTASRAAPLGLVAATALVVGNMIGSGTFLLPASLAPYGGYALAGWAVSFAGALLLAAVFAALSARMPAAGGPYAYARAAFGDLAGFTTGWLYWLSIVSGNAAIAVAFAGSFGALLPQAASTPARSAACAIAALWACTAFNLAGLRAAGAVQVTTVVLKVLPLVAIAAIGAFALEPAALVRPPTIEASPLALVSATSALTLWAFVGLECATVPAQAVRDARRNVPRATWIGTVVAAVVTVAACSVVVALVPPGVLAKSGAPFADAARALWGEAAAVGFAVAGAIACFGTLNGWVMMQGQMPAAIARDGLFPAAFAREDARGTPVFALVVASLASTALIVAKSHGSLVGLFTASILISTAATLVSYVACALAQSLRERNERRPGLAAVAVLALAYSVWALVGAGPDSLLWCAGAAAVGLVVYFASRRARPL